MPLRTTGYLVSVDDAPALAKSLVDLLEHPDRAREMGRAGYVRANRLFTWQTVVRRRLRGQSVKKPLSRNRKRQLHMRLWWAHPIRGDPANAGTTAIISSETFSAADTTVTTLKTGLHDGLRPWRGGRRKWIIGFSPR